MKSNNWFATLKLRPSNEVVLRKNEVNDIIFRHFSLTIVGDKTNQFR